MFIFVLAVMSQWAVQPMGIQPGDSSRLLVYNRGSVIANNRGL